MQVIFTTHLTSVILFFTAVKMMNVVLQVVSNVPPKRLHPGRIPNHTPVLCVNK